MSMLVLVTGINIVNFYHRNVEEKRKYDDFVSILIFIAQEVALISDKLKLN
jgi:hypothetical protein